MRRALVSLPDGVWDVLDKELKGNIGDGDSEVIRNLVIGCLTEKGYILKSKKELVKEETEVKQIAVELDTLDSKLAALVDVLEEKSHLKSGEWEARIKRKIGESLISDR